MLGANGAAETSTHLLLRLLFGPSGHYEDRVIRLWRVVEVHLEHLSEGRFGSRGEHEVEIKKLVRKSKF